MSARDIFNVYLCHRFKVFLTFLRGKCIDQLEVKMFHKNFPVRYFLHKSSKDVLYPKRKRHMVPNSKM